MVDFINRMANVENAREERRRFPRLKIKCPVEFRFFDGNRYRQSVTCDISEGGVCFLTDGTVDAGTHVYFRAKLQNRPEGFCGIARACWSSPGPYSEKYRVGLEFVEAGSIRRTDISSFIEENKLSRHSS